MGRHAKYPGLHDDVFILGKTKDFNVKELYDDYDYFKGLHPELYEETYRRVVRRVCNDAIINAKLDIKHKDEVRNVERSNKDLNGVSFKSITQNGETEYAPMNRVSFKKQNNRGEYKRMVVLSDLHSGHMLGLTPPAWQYSKDNEKLGEIARLQSEGWEWYTNAIKEVGKDVDILVCNGDLIDGRGDRSGNAEVITTDRMLQVAIGVEALEKWNAKKVFFTRGTPYHTGNGEEFENIAADRMGGIIDDFLNLEVNGKVFNFKHKVGNSGVPYGKATPVLKQKVINQLETDYNDMPNADVVIRSHVHNMHIIQNSVGWAITTPALQLNSRFGRQQCSGIIDYGFIVIDVYENGDIDVSPVLAKLNTNKPSIIKV